MQDSYGSLTSDDVITGEAVALDLPAASLATRVVSGAIDMLVTGVLAVIVFFVYFGAALPTDEALMHVALVGGMVTVLLVFPTVLETSTRGRSIGKMVMGLRTVREDGGPISAQHAFVRALLAVVEIYAFSGVPAFFTALLNEKGKRLGDLAAGTYVVRDRVRLTLPAPIEVPGPLRAWAAQADIAPLPTALALQVRQFVQRAHGLTPSSRVTVGQRLAASVAPLVSPPPPPGTPTEAFLAAVIGERRRRDQLRLQREAALRARLSSVRSAGR
ncbi:MAG: RDD family protein [Nocardioides sp.]|uniref:RDD family protein n=1 Tax=Nocardioides sp. TaxID=35761 RepID=UPI003F009386